MRRLAMLALVAGWAATWAVPAWAGDLDPTLEMVLQGAGEREVVSALLYLADAVDLRTLEAELTAQRAAPEVRHHTVVTALRDKAAATQGALLEELKRLYVQGEVAFFQPFWIANMVRVDAAPAVLESLAARSDVGMTYYNYEIESITPVHTEPSPEPPGMRTPEPGLVAIRAPEAWALGFDGTGVLVSSLDTGVAGNHAALASRWRGLDPRYTGHPGWAFFDPVTNWTFPQDSGSHGTHTMGTICGGAPGDQVGVAPGAQWIHAAVIDRVSLLQTCTDAILAFQWVIDPDGNPGTFWDVPTVCSNSWGIGSWHNVPPYNSPCDPSFWGYLDACEAAGIVVVFAAGNEGSSANTLRRPSDRATDEYRTCAVAALDGNSPPTYPIAGFSSRGPTYCTPTGAAAIKPEVAAPGVSVRSSVPSGYSNSDGTSMATPHVAGVVALIRQACPQLTVDQVKEIMYETAVDLGAVGNDNDYGYGMVDAYEAVVMAVSMCGPHPPRAFDGYFETGVNAPVLTTLSAIDYDGQPDPPGAITYKITVLPAAGNTLTDTGNGHVIGAGELPYALVGGGNQVLYTPTGGYWGNDTFQFVASDGGVPPDGGDSDPATVTVLVKFGPPVITTTVLPDGYLNYAYAPFPMQASEGQPELTWVVLGEDFYQEVNLGSSQFTTVGTARSWRADDTSWPYTLPFAFPYYGVDRTTVNVCSNGFLDFTSSTTDWTNTDAELIAATRIAVMWDDLMTNQNTGDDIYIDETVSNQVTIRWQGMTYASPRVAINVAVTLYADGRIRFHYGSGNTNLTPTVGISKGADGAYLLSSYNNLTVLTNANSLEIFPPSPLPEGMYLTPAGVLMGTPTEFGVFAPRIRVTDSLNRSDLAELDLTIHEQGFMFVTGSNPPSGWVDARQPFDRVTLEPQGLTSVQLTFNLNAESLTPAHFSVTEACSAGECDHVAPTLASVVGAGTTAALTFDRPIDPKAWTVVTHVGSGTSVSLGFLPGDVDASRTATAADIVALVNYVNAAFAGGTPPVQSSDIDRSGNVTASDIITVINLLNGAAPFEAYFGKSLP
ncbi:MAG TPA: S8 family serine peptidase [Phycisphaerae bacterium]|nr:S8 family serine peptidase [Phycisphaerae bacterium]HNU43747.1 S8 family serine peptidase [Phycisphaerae bacterium]